MEDKTWMLKVEGMSAICDLCEVKQELTDLHACYDELKQLVRKMKKARKDNDDIGTVEERCRKHNDWIHSCMEVEQAIGEEVK